MEKKAVHLRWRAHDKIGNHIAFSNDGKWIASGGRDLLVKIWDPQSGELLQSYIDHGRRINKLVFSNDNKYLATCGEFGQVKIWHMENFPEVSFLSIQGDESGLGVTSMDFTIDSTMLVISCYNRIEFLDVKTGQLVKKILQNDNGFVKNMALSPDGKYIATDIATMGIKIFDCQTNQTVMHISHNSYTVCLTFSQ